jgi:hypothetical protein
MTCVRTDRASKIAATMLRYAASQFDPLPVGIRPGFVQTPRGNPS